LKLREAGWEVSQLFDGDESLAVVYGVAFGPDSGVFYLQAGLLPTTPGGAVSNIRLFGVDTDTNRVSPYMPLPGGDTDSYLQTLGVVGVGYGGGRQ
jgi:hypothetical protein